MQLESSESGFNANAPIPVEQKQYTMLLHEQISEGMEGKIYFSLPDQENYLYEYEGDLEEALQDLPAIYGTTVTSIEGEQSVQPNPTLTLEAVAVIQQLWNYFDQTGAQTFQGAQDYNFQVEGNWLLIEPKDNTQNFFAISRDGQVESTFSPEQQENLMERFAIAYHQTQMTIDENGKNQDWELE